METSEIGLSASCATNVPSFSPSWRYGSSFLYSSGETAGMLTAFFTAPVSR